MWRSLPVGAWNILIDLVEDSGSTVYVIFRINSYFEKFDLTKLKEFCCFFLLLQFTWLFCIALYETFHLVSEWPLLLVTSVIPIYNGTFM